ncbi:MAG: extracellular solute-binding protein [Thermaerobacter sp.]|nr:extracellular solute-binding protein [Thermaerobacter sp.]
METKNNGITRRDLMKTAVVAGSALVGGGVLTGLAGCGTSSTPAASSSGKVSAPTGTGTVAIECDAGQNEAPFQWFSSALKTKYGAEVNMIGLPFVGQYQRLVTELVARSAVYDLMVFPPQFMGDFVAKGFLEPLDQYTSLVNPNLPDVMPAYRDPNLMRNGKLYALPYDGDILMLTYRQDLFSDPTEQANFQKKYGRPLAVPTTWDEFIQVAQFFTRPPHLYGAGIYGQRGFCYAWFVNIMAAYGGKWFDSSMNATVNSPAGVTALTKLLEIANYCPPGVLQTGYPQLNQIFLDGSTAMVIQWDDLPLKVDNPAMSQVVGKGSFAPCPVRNYMPYSRVMAVSAFSNNKARAYEVAAYMTLEGYKYVYDPNCGEDPYRTSQLHASLVKTHTGQPSMPAAQASEYVNAIKGCIATGYPELSIPGAPQYLDLLDLFVNQALAGTLSPKAALDSAASEWDSLTQSLGVSSQTAAYQAWITSFREAGIQY